MSAGFNEFESRGSDTDFNILPFTVICADTVLKRTQYCIASHLIILDPPHNVGQVQETMTSALNRIIREVRSIRT